MKKDLIVAIDEGTTGVTSLVMNTDLEVIAISSHDFPQHYPQPGWVEHDLNEIVQALEKTIKDVFQKVDVNRIQSIGITNQRETIAFWDRKNGKPVGRAIVWQDRRTADQCEHHKKAGLESELQKDTGLLLDPYFSGTKIEWKLKNDPEAKKLHEQSELCIGTMDSYLIYLLTGGESHVTEPSNASRTLLMSLSQQQYSHSWLNLFEVREEALPKINNSFSHFGKTKKIFGLPEGIPITGVLGDQQSALLGQACISPGQAKCTYGTGAFILMNTGSKPVLSQHRLLTTVAWKNQQNQTTYALEGSAFIAGAAVQWFRDGLGLIQSSSEIESLAASVSSSEGVVFVPALTGLGAPYWNPEARGVFAGMTRGTTKAHLARALLEGIAFQIADIIQAMSKDLGENLKSLNVDGGASENHLLMQFQSDLLGVSLRRPHFIESTALGAVFASGLGSGVWTDLSAIEKSWKEGQRFIPRMNDSDRSERLKAWHKVVQFQL